KKFMHRKTFENAPASGWAREDVELEAVLGVTNIDPKKLYEFLRADPSTGNPVRGSLFSDANNYRELRRSGNMEAFSVGFPIDEIPWTADAHAIRESNPHVWLAIEDDRFEVDERTNKRRLSVGTDVMDDVYYDTKDFTLLRNKMSIRSRKRWDTPTETRRILIGLKRDGDVTNGFKNVSKTDVRNDGASAEDLAGFDDAMRTGMTSWDGTPEPSVPLKELYERLDAKGLLPDSPTFKGVLQLEPKTVLRSIRSRYHLNEVSTSDILALYKLGGERLTALAKASADARAAGAVPAAKEAAALAFEKKVAATLDRSLIAERAAAKLQAIDPAFVPSAATIAAYMPDAPKLSAPTSIDDLVRRKGELEKRRVVAETISDLYHELAKDLDDGSSDSLRRVITRSLDRTAEAHAELYVEWRKSLDKKLGPKTTYDPFVSLWNENQLADYNAFGTAQRAANVRKFRDFAPLDAAGFANLRAQLENERARIWGRQIEEAGTAARALWFDQARSFYVPESRRETSNFIIDTMDFTMAYTADVWDGVPEAERNAAHELDESKLINAVLVNEAQIELLAGGEYVKRVQILSSAHDRARDFMKKANAAGVATDEATYKTLFDSLKAKNDADLKTELARLGVALEPEQFREGILPTLLTNEIRDGALNRDVLTALDGAKFVFDEYQTMQAKIAKMKEDKVKDVLTDAGAPNTIGWAPTAGGKGELALAIVKEREAAASPPPPPPAGVGIVNAFEGASNHTIGTASVLERKTYAGKLGKNERDYYKLKLQPGEKISAKVSGAANATITFHRSNGTRILPNDAAALEFTATSPITVYVRVRGATAQAEGAYSLEVR
ncbi:MAG: hypothetical protein ACAI25_01210, partial [Planctomycetota bacterium]